MERYARTGSDSIARVCDFYALASRRRPTYPIYNDILRSVFKVTVEIEEMGDKALT